jgi:hypothetical protein
MVVTKKQHKRKIKFAILPYAIDIGFSPEKDCIGNRSWKMREPWG